MSAWTDYPLCDECFEALEPGQEPVRLRAHDDEVCCRCHNRTTSGIYYRADPKWWVGVHVH